MDEMRPEGRPRTNEDAHVEETEVKDLGPSTLGEPPCMLPFIDAMDEVRPEYLPCSDTDVQSRGADDKDRDNTLADGSAKP